MFDQMSMCLSKQCFQKKNQVLFYFVAYSKVSNWRTVSNKPIQAYQFCCLLHKNARFWPFLANFHCQINTRTGTSIQYFRVHVSIFDTGENYEEIRLTISLKRKCLLRSHCCAPFLISCRHGWPPRGEYYFLAISILDYICG